MLPQEVRATARAAGFDGISKVGGVGGVCGSEDTGDDGPECEGDGGVGSGVPVGLYKILGWVVGSDDAINPTLMGGTDDEGT